jgi:hypothetical protein
MSKDDDYKDDDYKDDKDYDKDEDYKDEKSGYGKDDDDVAEADPDEKDSWK